MPERLWLVDQGREEALPAVRVDEAAAVTIGLFLCLYGAACCVGWLLVPEGKC